MRFSLDCSECPKSNTDVFRGGAGRGNRGAVLAHAFKVELHCLTDEFLDLVQRCTGYSQAGKIWCVSTPTGRRPLVDHEIFHFSPACLRILFNVPGGMSTDGWPATVTVAGFNG